MGEMEALTRADVPKDANKKKNWLPALKGGFQFAARFHSPHAPLLDGSYAMPGIVRVE
jgi:hypothetical protein